MQCSHSLLVSFPLLSNWGSGVGRVGPGLVDSGICRVTGLVSRSGRELKTGIGVEGVDCGLGSWCRVLEFLL